ncbi:twin-arginine translocase TatA/TatE family subunit [Sorangium sp. So ce375]|uniref:twin-arginine translocase TatA/TatE family subunit n=1 Tax=Sorangium sp. So ce375 TaxID=3133306 RepID=UPI003F5C92AF
MGRIGPLEIALLIGLALLLFGAGRIADVGKGIGEGIRNFKKGLRDDEEEDAAKQLPAKPDAKEEDSQKPV